MLARLERKLGVSKVSVIGRSDVNNIHFVISNQIFVATVGSRDGMLGSEGLRAI
jgi:hypothetical protein